MTNSTLARRALAALDLTCLEESAEPERIEALCRAALTRHGPVAAVCLYPEFIRDACRWLDGAGGAGVRVASVANFPDGRAEAAAAAREVRRAVMAGADEIDVVFPYRAFLAGNAAAGQALVTACKNACGERAQLKVILESGEYDWLPSLRQAAELAIRAGADFIKTSTGMSRIGATPEAAGLIMEVIAEQGGRCGFKASGGIRTVDQAIEYLRIADTILGPEWSTPARFRIGASSLLEPLLTAIDGG